MEIEIKQIDPIEPPVILYKGGVKTLMQGGNIYVSEGFQIIRQDEDSATIRETYNRISKNLEDVNPDRRL